jgi:hypothetical protein
MVWTCNKKRWRRAGQRYYGMKISEGVVVCSSVWAINILPDIYLVMLEYFLTQHFRYCIFATHIETTWILRMRYVDNNRLSEKLNDKLMAYQKSWRWY